MSRWAELELLAGALSREHPIPLGASSAAAVVTGQDLRGHPAADVKRLGAGHHERDDEGAGPQGDQRAPLRNGPMRFRMAADCAFGHLDEDAPVAQDRPRGRHVGLHPQAAAPYGQSPPR